ncbi:DUF4416 domain-containing protein [Desulfonema ishimotonii]|uniref:DUF4416 domain-containing protein n=1 Tax=Desulfonema ishimotonii TaxID=45657 RepID=A0A401G3M2_9BACT|nr:DUF4416 family protein [Desulfonema ishimotonii]GBC63842.1 DUF4416 domain-containing protein [Desulfonema ishimotonii]
MSIPRPPQPAKLITGLFMKDKTLLPPVAEALCGEFGPADLVSAWLPFDYTGYYETEMGTPLFRRMLSFRTLIEQDALPDIKHFTNALEKNYSDAGRRRINIDPGYMILSRFVLATGKNFAHRIYVGRGIYADLTLIYAKGGFQPLPWTYPDYSDQPMTAYLAQVRKRYVNDLDTA